LQVLAHDQQRPTDGERPQAALECPLDRVPGARGHRTREHPLDAGKVDPRKIRGRGGELRPDRRAVVPDTDPHPIGQQIDGDVQRGIGLDRSA